MESASARTPLYLQRALVEEIKRITEDMLFQNPKSEESSFKLNVHAQTLPIPTKKDELQEDEMQSGTIDYVDESEEDGVFKCPWCLVKIDSGIIAEINGKQQVDIGICFGIFNDNIENQGHMEILNLIQKVYERFSLNPILDKQYVCKGSFEWGLLEDDMYPYFFGAIGTTFEFVGYRREMIY